MRAVLETERLKLRELEPGDAAALALVLSDAAAMRFYPAPLDRPKVDAWIARNRARYQTDGSGLWAVEWRASGRLVGDCGLVRQSLEGVTDSVLEVGYHVLPDWQGRGIATEAAAACLKHAHERLGAARLYAFVRPENLPSRRVAEKLGMHVERTLVRGEGDFLHEIWVRELSASGR
jgi:RimJ/RimL family protein N-acetyltransferase